MSLADTTRTWDRRGVEPPALSTPTPLTAPLELDGLCADAPFSELHRRIVDAPIEQVWPECLAVEGREVRTLGPLMAIRMIPSILRGRGSGPQGSSTSLLSEFGDHGFALLREDPAPRDGRAVVIFGAAGKFWSVSENAPIAFADPGELVAFDEPDHAVTAARLEARSIAGGATLIETETRVWGTDPASTKKFRPYWAAIRPFSGLIRRSWLAAIERRVNRGG